jgi:hypothetical protein
MIAAQQIDATIEWLDGLHEEERENVLDQFADKQPDLLGYVMSDEVDALGDAEAELLLHIALVFWKTAEKNGVAAHEVNAETIDALQDDNWALFDDREQGKDEPFADFVEPVIADYEEPELLYYVVDVFTEDEGDEFSMEASSKLPMFVMLKTVADALFLQ